MLGASAAGQVLIKLLLLPPLPRYGGDDADAERSAAPGDDAEHDAEGSAAGGAGPARGRRLSPAAGNNSPAPRGPQGMPQPPGGHKENTQSWESQGAGEDTAP